MRIGGIVLLLMVLFNLEIAAQQTHSVLQADSISDVLYQNRNWSKLAHFGNKEFKNNNNNYDFLYRTGFAYFNLGMYASSEKFFNKAFSIYQTEDAAKHIYLGLLMRGLDLESTVFNEHNSQLTEISTHFKKGTESYFLDAGSRISSNTDVVGNVLYTDFGRISRPTEKVVLTQTAYFLQQTNPMDNYKQFEYSISRQSYLKNGFYLKPTLHYALTLYNINTQTYTAKYYDSLTTFLPLPLISTTVISNGNWFSKYQIPGNTNSFGLSYEVKKRINAFTIGIEPTLQAIFDKNSIISKDTLRTQVDSFVYYTLVKSYPYTYNTSHTIDTGKISFVGQIGTSISWMLPIKNSPVTASLAAYYLFDNDKNSAFAFNFYTFIKANTNLWLHLSYTQKGKLPWLYNVDEQYFNTYNVINNRSSITLQFLPLRHWSPMLTYQLENETRSTDDKKINYNSFYLTLKYNL